MGPPRFDPFHGGRDVVVDVDRAERSERDAGGEPQAHLLGARQCDLEPLRHHAPFAVRELGARRRTVSHTCWRSIARTGSRVLAHTTPPCLGSATTRSSPSPAPSTPGSRHGRSGCRALRRASDRRPLSSAQHKTSKHFLLDVRDRCHAYQRDAEQRGAGRNPGSHGHLGKSVWILRSTPEPPPLAAVSAPGPCPVHRRCARPSTAASGSRPR
jgi:hypothetical protein